MPKLHPISPKTLIKILEQEGFVITRIKGSHHFMQHQNGRTTVIPMHGNEDIGVGLLAKIIRDTGINGGII